MKKPFRINFQLDVCFQTLEIIFVGNTMVLGEMMKGPCDMS